MLKNGKKFMLLLMALSLSAGAFAGCDQLTSVTFRAADGWMANGEALDVSDPAVNAANLLGAYGAYAWTRIVTE